MAALLDFVVKVYVVNTALTIAAIFLTQSKPLNLLNFALTPVFPLNSAGWWYITGYAVVLIAMPMLNRWFNGLSQREATWFMAILLTLTSVLPFFNFATSIIPMYATNGGLWMLVMYWVGAYLRRYPFYQDWSLQRLFGVLGVVSVVIVARFGLMIWRPVGFRGLLDTLHWIPTWPWADHDPMFLIWRWRYSSFASSLNRCQCQNCSFTCLLKRWRYTCCTIPIQFPLNTPLRCSPTSGGLSCTARP
ncbi:hypothetical protein [Lacticaseibacillus nasuensis]|uniref:hypothetical protein n=1 Tax=Lacticaseibacillus nasuensis TaxID=944671 RepID=UPI000AA82B45|nr:hypothetical protein [Lacticaseibacillus nasuensis]